MDENSCKQAAVEQDSEKRAALILEINSMLEAKESRLRGNRSTSQPEVETDSNAGMQP